MNIKKEEWTYLNKKIKKWGQLIVEAKDGNLLDDRNIYHQPRKAPSIIDPKLYFCVMMNGDPRGGIGGGYDVRSFCWCTERNGSIITRMVSSAGLALTKRKGRQAGMHACGRRRRPMKTPQSLLILHRILIFLPFLVKERGGDWPEGICPTVSSRKAIHQSVGMRFSNSNPIAQIPKLAVLFAL